jgi:hypothetical protein
VALWRYCGRRGLLPQQTFEMKPTLEGVYDYFARRTK